MQKAPKHTAAKDCDWRHAKIRLASPLVIARLSFLKAANGQKVGRDNEKKLEYLFHNKERNQIKRRAILFDEWARPWATTRATQMQ